MFPIIRHIDDILLSLVERQEFIVTKKEHYTAVDYRYVLSDSFDDLIRTECRGIKFDPNGNIIARPLHKFFNYGEKPHTQPSVIDFSKPHVVMEKLDGSMIHPAIINDDVCFMTRMGVTDQSKLAEKFLTNDRKEILRYYLKGGYTPIFEYVGPENRIVEFYEKSNLVLLQMRNTIDGKYFEALDLKRIAELLKIDLATIYSPFSDHKDVDLIFARRQGEGVVIRFEDNLWIKIKTTEYRRLHRLKSNVTREHDLVSLILDDEIDDLIPLLDVEVVTKIMEFSRQINSEILKTSIKVGNIVTSGKHLDQKSFAVNHLSNQSKEIKSLCFSLRKNEESPFDLVKRVVKEHTTNAKSFENVRSLLGGANLEISLYLGDE